MAANIRRRASKELDHVEERISSLKDELEKQRQHAEKLRAFLSVYDELAPEEDGAESEDEDDQTGLRKPGLKLIDASVMVIREAGKPLGAKDIAKRILRGGYPYDNDLPTLVKSLRGVLSRNTGPDGVLSKPGRGLYDVANGTGAEDKSDADGDLFAGEEKPPATADGSE